MITIKKEKVKKGEKERGGFRGCGFHGTGLVLRVFQGDLLRDI